ncbi:fido domain-containing protein [Mycena maculata]|uniref:Fido domain-containing protein n=1 Tax=Mycena maculata TaxID=230809 RepID=A0AAD7N6E6_9AGAR|nr:fido domain-containing protein [Mycena maculata]
MNIRPNFVRDEEPIKAQDIARFYEGILQSNRECAEMAYVRARLAISYSLLGATGSAIELAQEVQAQLSEIGIEDSKFDDRVNAWEKTLQEEAVNALNSDMSAPTYQGWKPTRGHIFPSDLSLPQGHEDLLKWRSLSEHGSENFRKLLIVNAIETNHIESIFLITLGSTQNLIRDGVDQGVIEAHDQSDIKENGVIKSILEDTLLAYDIVNLVVKHQHDLTSDKISEIHSRVVATARFHGQHYVPPGDTRTTTRHTVYVNTPTGRVKFCPYNLVDSELVVICKLTKTLMVKMSNPFAVASWLHLVLAGCHPFDDGNGRVTRLVASIPLLLAGYPPICISLEQRSAYVQAIHDASNGNHAPLTQCIFEGMKGAIKMVEELKD